MRTLINKISAASLVIVIYMAIAVPAALCDDTAVRIGLAKFGNPKEIQIKALSGNLCIKAPNIDFSLPYGQTALLAATQSGIEAKISPDSPVQIDGVLVISPDGLSSGISVTVKGISAKSYLGSLEISSKAGVLQLVNIVGLEDYLAGVLPAEMPDSYPLEALKAQAVAARTYTLRNISKHSSSGYGLCDASHCQVYSGIVTGKAKSMQAVSDTRNMVLTYSNKLADVLYSADGGGHTQNYSEIRPDKKIPYLCGVKDPEDVYHTSWEKVYPVAELAGRLLKAGIKEADGLKSLQVDKSGVGGRALSVSIAGASAKTTITAAKLRSILGYDVIKSTLFAIDSSKNGTIKFNGKGFGHGIGLCQVGARGLAQRPYDYTCSQILTHYFPGTQILSLSALGMQADAADAGKDNTQMHKPDKSEPAHSSPSAEKNIQFDVRVVAPEPL